MKKIFWFSCGAASFACLWLYDRTRRLRDTPYIVVAYCDTGSEHPDNKRFLYDTERCFGIKIKILKNDKYLDHFDVCQKERYINGVNGARCTVELKKRLRFRLEESGDEQIFGYTIDETHRSRKLISAYPEINARFPLIEAGWNKQDCINLLHRIGIEIPAMYRLGYENNNCIGCVKGGAGYWNKIRKDFPEQFNRMAQIEREVGRSCIRNKFLDELKEEDGRGVKGFEMSCDFVCQSMDIDK